MAHDHPVQNSEVYLLNSTHAPSIPPPSPPSPATPCDRALSPPPEDILIITPPEPQNTNVSSSQRLAEAVHVLGTEATALSHLTRLYETDPLARAGFNAAVDAINRYGDDKGKLVICGVGKSGHIAKKMVATFNSLRIHATYLHPTEALHGDLGKVKEHDTILLVTFSGKTPELLQLIPHFDPQLPLIVMTSHTHPSSCEIAKRRPNSILLPSPIHMSETDSFGFSAPTTSTTIALALGDALAVVVSGERHCNVAAVFLKNHPGGAIGASIKSSRKLSDLAISLDGISEIGSNAITGAHVLMAAYQSDTGWVRKDDSLMPPRRIKRMQPDDMEEPATQIKDLMVSPKEWIRISGDLTLPNASEWVASMRQTTQGNKFSDDAILALVDDDEDIIGFMEIGDLSR